MLVPSSFLSPSLLENINCFECHNESMQLLVMVVPSSSAPGSCVGTSGISAVTGTSGMSAFTRGSNNKTGLTSYTVKIFSSSAAMASSSSPVRF